MLFIIVVTEYFEQTEIGEGVNNTLMSLCFAVLKIKPRA
jgi:hypothetical protein